MAVDLKKIVDYYREQYSFKVILDMLGAPESKNSRKITYINNIESKLHKRGVKIFRAEIVKVFRLLDSAGCGACIRGINGKRTRMEWVIAHTSLVDLAKATSSVEETPIINEGTSGGSITEEGASSLTEILKQGSLANLGLIACGMTHADVVALLGREGGFPNWNQPKEAGHKTYAWGDDRNRWVYFVNFDENSVVTKVSLASID